MFAWGFSIINTTGSALEEGKPESERVPSPAGQTPSAPSKLLTVRQLVRVKASLNANTWRKSPPKPYNKTPRKLLAFLNEGWALPGTSA